jgi:hypothetical protein
MLYINQYKIPLLKFLIHISTVRDILLSTYFQIYVVLIVHYYYTLPVVVMWYRSFET